MYDYLLGRTVKDGDSVYQIISDFGDEVLFVTRTGMQVVDKDDLEREPVYDTAYWLTDVEDSQCEPYDDPEIEAFAAVLSASKPEPLIDPLPVPQVVVYASGNANAAETRIFDIGFTSDLATLFRKVEGRPGRKVFALRGDVCIAIYEYVDGEWKWLKSSEALLEEAGMAYICVPGE